MRSAWSWPPEVANRVSERPAISLLAQAQVTEESVIGEKSSSLVVRLLDPQKNTVPDIHAEYDLASLGEVDRVIGPNDHLIDGVLRAKGFGQKG
jgi:hypothetical protein